MPYYDPLILQVMKMMEGSLRTIANIMLFWTVVAIMGGLIMLVVAIYFISMVMII